MVRVLFVDDDQRVIDGLRRMLRSMHHEWEMEFVLSGAQALEVMAQQPFDVVISDMRMPVMDGAQLLSEVARLYPNTVRIILSGYSDQDLIFKSVGAAHQYLSKPCDAETLKTVILKAGALRNLLKNNDLQQLLTQIKTLPSVPSLYVELIGELKSPHSSLKKIGEIISKDISMTAKLLQIINSAFFGLRRTISNPTDAVGLLGVDIILSLTLSLQVFSQLSGKANSDKVEGLWRHSSSVALFAKQISSLEGCSPDITAHAFTAGMLHDTGTLVLMTELPDKYALVTKMVKEENMKLLEAERAVFGATHPEVGAYLMGLWGLPDPIIEAVAYHHTPSDYLGNEFNMVSAVHIANAYNPHKGLYENLRDDDTKFSDALLDYEYLKKLNIESHIAKWNETLESLNERLN